jgi:Meckel syndrome type 1 protein
MISERQNPDDLENLSALFDGELDGDAARFVRRRLGHDAGWQQVCGRWQLIGDALRGQATAAAPADFAHRVAAAVAAEPVLAIGPVNDPLVMPVAPQRPLPAARKLPRGWIGGALAASMALVAVFAVRSPEPQPAADRAIAVEPAAITAPASVASAVPTDAPVAPPAIEAPEILQIAAAPAPTRLVRSRADEQAARESTARIARAVQRQAAGPAAQDAAAPAVLADAAPDPFRPRTDIVTRPWPRAVLPNSQAAGALTASFDVPVPPSARSRPFYPFEPPSQVDSAATHLPRP